MDAELHDLRAKIAGLEETAALYRELQANYHALEERAELELKHQKEHSAQEIHRAVTRANEKDSEAIEARKSERQALDRAARAEGQVEALEKQLGLAKKEAQTKGRSITWIALIRIPWLITLARDGLRLATVRRRSHSQRLSGALYASTAPQNRFSEGYSAKDKRLPLYWAFNLLSHQPGEPSPT
jgi:hypothetical protein